MTGVQTCALPIFLARLLLLRTSTTWKVTKVHRARNSFPLPCLGSKLLDDRSGVVLDLDVLITAGNSLLFIFFHSSYSYGKENKLRVKKKKKKEEEVDDTYFVEWSLRA